MAKTEDSTDAQHAQPSAGTVIAPGSAEGQAPLPPAPPAAPDPTPVEATVAPPEAQAPTSPEQTAGILSEDDGQSVTWTASEFVAHDKSAGWYALLAAGTVVLAVIVFLIMRDLVSVSVVVIAGIVFGIYAGHQPRQQEYMLNNQGLGIGAKHYSYGEFKWFSVVPEGAFSSIVLMPHRRFAPLTTVYYAPEDEDRVLSILSQHLPLEEHTPDAVDSLMRRIRF